ncbi:PTS system IIA component (Glc family) [Mycoplasmopsis mustelae]|uniref:PTS system IIA component (Glc family) n=1 Tax=Mycoplasmopsis mustelae TaxID=171289 RepID=A0A4V3FNX6_9BACT|nr:PTS glucose transporter subunit IIA [Mycoplasmopsis mustelae]TDV24290.1 PTS system IIA component (Glc family) [Mycoplasmopsis mustelae]
MGFFTKLFGKKNVEPEIKNELFSPISGKFINLVDIKDPAFSQGALGVGFGVEFQTPSGLQKVLAPVSGEVVLVFPSKHAICIETKNKAHVLVHFGINTVKLEGQGLNILVSQGDKVSVGDPLLEVDIDLITKSGYISDVLVFILPESHYKKIEFTPVRETGEMIEQTNLIANFELNCLN